MDEYCYPDIVLLDKSNVATGYFPPVENLHRIHHNPLGISFFSVPLFEYQKVVMRLKTIVFDTNKTIVWKMQPPELKKQNAWGQQSENVGAWNGQEDVTRGNHSQLSKVVTDLLQKSSWSSDALMFSERWCDFVKWVLHVSKR